MAFHFALTLIPIDFSNYSLIMFFLLVLKMMTMVSSDSTYKMNAGKKEFKSYKQLSCIFKEFCYKRNNSGFL